MNYAAALVLVNLAAVFLLAGIFADSPAAFVLATVASAGAVLFLVRRVKSRRTKTFVSHPPPCVDPFWTLESSRSVRDVELPVELEIDHVIDGYRSLVAAEVLPSLETLSVDELRKVIQVERAGRNRQAIIHRAEVLIDLTEGPAKSGAAVVDPAAPTRRSRRTVSTSVAAAIEQKAPSSSSVASKKKSGPDLTL